MVTWIWGLCKTGQSLISQRTHYCEYVVERIWHEDGKRCRDMCTTKKRDMYTYHFNALFVTNKVKKASANDPQGYNRDARRT